MQVTHPNDQTLKAYGLGKLVDEQASSINEHLESCADCRQRVSGLTSDSFLGRFRDGQQPAERSIGGGSLIEGTLSFIQAKAPALPPATDTLPPGLASHPDYEIKRELGRGGMGVVYLAHNTMMGRDEVLKVMGRNIMERPGVLERFQREIRAVAKLRHPNIVAAYHAFRIEGGLVFSMEYVEGLDLARLVTAKGPLSVAHAT
jgi:serine/threonine protein kinase